MKQKMNQLNSNITKIETSQLYQMTKEDTLPDIIRYTKSQKLQFASKGDMNEIMQSLTNKNAKINHNHNNQQLCITNEIRVDAYGVPITKRKKQKVTFIDRLNPFMSFCQECKIESYKEYNLAMSYPDNFHGGLGKSTSMCSCSLCSFN